MTNDKYYKLVIQITSPWVVEKIDYISKCNSVLFVDYTKIVENIFRDFETDKDFNLFRFKLCTLCRDFTKIKQYSNWYRIESPEIEITQNALANCLPRKIRVKYFYYDKFYERYLLKSDFNLHLL
jgi:hypothetical protein